MFHSRELFPASFPSGSNIFAAAICSIPQAKGHTCPAPCFPLPKYPYGFRQARTRHQHHGLRVRSVWRERRRRLYYPPVLPRVGKEMSGADIGDTASRMRESRRCQHQRKAPSHSNTSPLPPPPRAPPLSLSSSLSAFFLSSFASSFALPCPHLLLLSTCNSLFLFHTSTLLQILLFSSLSLALVSSAWRVNSSSTPKPSAFQHSNRALHRRHKGWPARFRRELELLKSVLAANNVTHSEVKPISPLSVTRQSFSHAEGG